MNTAQRTHTTPRTPMVAQALWSKGCKHESFESGRLEQRSLTHILKKDVKR
jgi:hypothetical protein